MRKMREELAVAAKNTTWRYVGMRAIYPDGQNTLECAIFHESLLCAYYVRNLLIEELWGGFGAGLLNRSGEYILSKYSTEYPELSLILLNLGPNGPLSPTGLSSDFAYRDAADCVFGTSCYSPLYRADFYAKNIPIIRITDDIFTLGTHQPQFSTVDDVLSYYRREARIEEIAKMCEFWLTKFYE